MFVDTFTSIHTVLSLVALVSGIFVTIGLLRSRMSALCTGLYFVTSVATDVTGFGFPFTHFLPSHWVGVISLVALAIALLALYAFHLAGAWRWIYVVTTLISVYFLVFVSVAQAFAKLPALRAMAPTQSEPPFAIAQLVVLVIFVAIIIAAVRRFHPASR